MQTPSHPIEQVNFTATFSKEMNRKETLKTIAVNRKNDGFVNTRSPIRKNRIRERHLQK